MKPACMLMCSQPNLCLVSRVSWFDWAFLNRYHKRCGMAAYSVGPIKSFPPSISLDSGSHHHSKANSPFIFSPFTHKPTSTCLLLFRLGLKPTLCSCVYRNSQALPLSEFPKERVRASREQSLVATTLVSQSRAWINIRFGLDFKNR